MFLGETFRNTGTRFEASPRKSKPPVHTVTKEISSCAETLGRRLRAAARFCDPLVTQFKKRHDFTNATR